MCALLFNNWVIIFLVIKELIGSAKKSKTVAHYIRLGVGAQPHHITVHISRSRDFGSFGETRKPQPRTPRVLVVGSRFGNRQRSLKYACYQWVFCLLFWQGIRTAIFKQTEKAVVECVCSLTCICRSGSLVCAVASYALFAHASFKSAPPHTASVVFSLHPCDAWVNSIAALQDY